MSSPDNPIRKKQTSISATAGSPNLPWGVLHVALSNSIEDWSKSSEFLKKGASLVHIYKNDTQFGGGICPLFPDIAIVL